MPPGFSDLPTALSIRHTWSTVAPQILDMMSLKMLLGRLKRF